MLCNSQKSNRDNSDFRELTAKYEKGETDCHLCREQATANMRNDMAIAIDDKYLVVKNHTLVTPIRHVPSFFELGTYVRKCCFLLIYDVRRWIQENDSCERQFNCAFGEF